MQILKIPWLGHSTENKNIECYSVTINSTGTRLASGGLDGYIKIWDVNTITRFFKLSDERYNKCKKSLEADVEISQLPDKTLRRPLCSMSRHNGVVTSLKFSPDGRWLASGSDDKIVLIWEKDDDQRPKAFGVEQEDLEHWTVRKRLVAHDNDIQDICWSPDGNLLVTVGLDRSIIIWNATTFERIKRYDVHQSMVKGIVFDPANKFFATASDDRTVRIFRYHKKLNEYNKYEFQMEHVVIEPFKKSPLTSYFRRMSWSPDGQHIAVPNATNGPVPSVAIVNRGNWGTDVSLIGHEAPVEVCSFSPQLFQTNGGDADENEDDPKFQTVLATGGQDRTLAVWSTYNSKPIVVCSDIVFNAITDICWAPDGETLYFSCLDGSITCVRFDKGELGEVVASRGLIDKQLNKYGTDREAAILPESVEQLQLEEKASKVSLANNSVNINNNQTATPTPTPIFASPKKSIETKSVENGAITSTPNQALVPARTIDTAKLRKQTISITKSGKKRVAPLLVSSSSPSSSSLKTAAAQLKPNDQGSALKKHKLESKSNADFNSKVSQPNYILPRLGLQTTVYGIKKRDSSIAPAPAEDEEVKDFDDMGGVAIQDESSSPTAQLSESALRRLKNREKRRWLETKYPSTFIDISLDLPESLFSNNALQNKEISKIYKAYASNNKDIVGEISNNSAIEFDEDSMFYVILRKTIHKQRANPAIGVEQVDEITTTIEVRNGKPWHEDDPRQEDRDFDDATKVIVYNNDPSDQQQQQQQHQRRLFTLYFPFRIQSILPILEEGLGGDGGDDLKYYVLCSFNGSVQVVSAKTGRYILPTIELRENVVSMSYRNGHLLVLTGSGVFYGWNLNTMKCYMKRISIAAVLNMTQLDDSVKNGVTTPGVKCIDLNSQDGSPYVLTDASNDVYGYCLDVKCWTKVIDSWYYNVHEDFSIENNPGLQRVLHRSKLNHKNDKIIGSLNTYKFTTAKSKVLKNVMTTRSKESLNMIQTHVQTKKID
ncbi:uncharacterized protein LODBEIA_P45210 [Lodderomyces beijingensis]|uniref:Protein HIR n=1 Tax=Lodderomyces beijingensis TaxID=1775926 RepID=A0ABP0ZSG7_9ASCO